MCQFLSPSKDPAFYILNLFSPFPTQLILLRACLCSLFQIIGSCVKLGICKAVPSLIESSSPRSIKFGPAMGISDLKAPWLLSYLTSLKCSHLLRRLLLECSQDSSLTLNQGPGHKCPINIEDHENHSGPHYLHSLCDAFAKWKQPSLNDRSEKHVAWCWSSVSTCPTRCVVKGLNSTGCILGGAERNCVAPF